MGVAGLWDTIRPAARTRSLTELAVVDGFEANTNKLRGFRVGIDASIWFFHAAYGKEGENPELRTLFFRCATLMKAPFLPLFVFDGPKRPKVKRGKKINQTSHWLTNGMRNIIDAFGFEWRTAPGEAEAELAYLNSVGIIDAVLSDDVDNFLFGAKMVIRNSSNTLSGNKSNPNKNSAGKDDKNHTVTYRLEDITRHPDIGLNRAGFILIGLLSGGDYCQAGLARCGPAIGLGLAKCGFGDRLYEAALTLSDNELPAFLDTWRDDLRHELRTNSKGLLGRKNPTLAKSVPADFPDIDILLSYVNPCTSESMGKAVEKNLKLKWDKEPDLGKLAALCEQYFEWGFKESIVKRFRTVMWPPIIQRILRRVVLDLDEKTRTGSLVGGVPSTPRKGNKRTMEIGTPSKMIVKHFSSLQLNSPRKKLDDSDDDENEVLIIKIHSARNHASTDGILEYRLEIAPAQLVRLTEAGVKGTRPPNAEEEWADSDEEGEKKAPVDPHTHLRVWMPAAMVRVVEPRLVEDFEDVEERKRLKKAGKGAVGKGKAPAKKLVYTEEEEESTSEDETRKAATEPKAKRTLSDKPAKPGGPAKDLKSFYPVKKSAKPSSKQSKDKPSTSKPVMQHRPPLPALDLSNDSDVSAAPLLKPPTAGSFTKKLIETRDLYLSDSDDPPAAERVSSKPISPSQAKPRLQPFPLNFSRQLPSKGLLGSRTTSSGSSGSAQTREGCSTPPTSDSALNPVTKSPRKSKEHSSHRSTRVEKRVSSPSSPKTGLKPIEDEDSESDSDAYDRPRPVSPSPVRVRTNRFVSPSPRFVPETPAVAHTLASRITISPGVIEISSDDGSPVRSTKKTLPPLLLAKAKSGARNDPTSLRSVNLFPKPPPMTKPMRRTGALDSDDVIDLT